MFLTADVAMGGIIAAFVGIGILIIAVCALIVFAVVKLIQKNRSVKSTAPEPLETVSEDNDGKEAPETKE